uniref:BPTI/Kunitz inhibitor domain-containing protein n=1 Tax=Terrapene triunguis TaxID=2587831 RepID=A0A674IYW7_9SAUR
MFQRLQLFSLLFCIFNKRLKRFSLWCLPRSNAICNLPAEPGPCFTYSRNYFYNSVTKTCEEFIYGGCQGNENRFDTMFRCLKTCGSSGKTARETQLVGS